MRQFLIEGIVIVSSATHVYGKHSTFLVEKAINYLTLEFKKGPFVRVQTGSFSGNGRSGGKELRNSPS